MDNDKPVLTPEQLTKLADLICMPFEGMPDEMRNGELIRRSIREIDDYRVRGQLTSRLFEMSRQASLYQSYFCSWSAPALFGAAAGRGELTALLYAIEPKRLSWQVLDSIEAEVSHLLGGLPCLPPKLRNAIISRWEEQDEAEREEEAEVKAEREKVEAAAADKEGAQ